MDYKILTTYFNLAIVHSAMAVSELRIVTLSDHNSNEKYLQIEKHAKIDDRIS